MSQPMFPAILKGLSCRCPRCGEGKLYTGFLTVTERCTSCGLDFSGHQADDAPPYVVMMIVGHVIVGAMLMVEKSMAPAMWIHAALFLPATLILSLALLRPVKGALIAIQWANAMHGFAATTVTVGEGDRAP